jgi:hypothetical protein
VNAAVGRVRAQRVAQKPGDYFPLILDLTALRELLGEYVDAFKAIMAILLQVIEEEHLEAAGEQDGIPNTGLDVPDSDGTVVKVRAKTSNKHVIDPDQVLGPIAALVMERWVMRTVREPDTALIAAEAPEEYAIEVAREALAMMGSAKMQTSRLKELRLTLGQMGLHQLADVVKDAETTTRKFEGTTVERKTA